MDKVEHLDLGRYFFELDSFPAEILSLSNLRKLELNLNSLTSLPPEIAYLEVSPTFSLFHASPGGGCFYFSFLF